MVTETRVDNDIGKKRKQTFSNDVDDNILVTSNKKKAKVSIKSSECKTNIVYFVVYVHYTDNNNDKERVLSDLNFKHMINLSVKELYGLVGESLYPYNVIVYNQEKHVGIIETILVEDKHSMLRSALTMYSGPYLNMPIRMDVVYTSHILLNCSRYIN